jgi:flagellar motor switch protein FliM
MQAFDFRSPPPLPASSTAALELALEAATARTGLLMSSMLRRPCTLTAGAPRRGGGPLPLEGATWFAVNLELATGPGALVVAPQGVVRIADVLMGGPGLPSERVPGALERSIVASRLTSGLAPLATALAHGAASFTITADESADTARRADMVTIPFAITIGSVETTFDLVVAFDVLFDADDDCGSTHDTFEADPALVDALHLVPVPVAVRFAPVKVTAADLDALAIGDVIRLEHPACEPLVGDVGGRPYFSAWPGRRGRRLAIQIEHVVEER